jgi:hypothetical protein
MITRKSVQPAAGLGESELPEPSDEPGNEMAADIRSGAMQVQRERGYHAHRGYDAKGRAEISAKERKSYASGFQKEKSS